MQLGRRRAGPITSRGESLEKARGNRRKGRVEVRALRRATLRSRTRRRRRRNKKGDAAAVNKGCQ
jgi:hypothetical protein